MSAGSDAQYVMGVDFGTESCRVGVFTLDGRPRGAWATPYKLTHPRPGWAEQSPDEWWDAFASSVRGALQVSGTSPEQVAGISVDATTCTVVALDSSGRPLRNAIMWMDIRASDQADRIGESTHSARKYNGGGSGPVSAEWFAPKLLWIKENEKETWDKSERLVECTDWATWKLTGRWTANVNTAAMRGYHDGDAGGWPEDFYAEIGLEDAFDKVPTEVLVLGEKVGELTKEAADHLGLREGIVVAQGGGDAFVAQIGLGVVNPGKMALITGSSHVLIGQSAEPVFGEGFWGSYTDAVVPGQYTVEGGQVSTGSVMKWFKDYFCIDALTESGRTGKSAYDVLNSQITDIPAGSDGLIVLDYWQGNRTPYTDALARGMIWGFTLAHTPQHVYKAIQEGTSYGTAHILRFMADAGFEVNEFVAAGGFTKSRQLIQLISDVTGKPITLTEVTDAAILGGSMLSAVAAGLYESIPAAAEKMVHEETTIEPDMDVHETYKPYVDAYANTYPAMRELVHGMAKTVNG